MEVVDLAPVFRRYADGSPGKRGFEAAVDLYWRVDNHLSPRGESLVALAVARHLLQSRLLEIPGAGDKLRRVDDAMARLATDTRMSRPAP